MKYPHMEKISVDKPNYQWFLKKFHLFGQGLSQFPKYKTTKGPAVIKNRGLWWNLPNFGNKILEMGPGD